MFKEKSPPVMKIKCLMLCNLYPIRTSIMYQSIIMYYSYDYVIKMCKYFICILYYIGLFLMYITM